ncbi:MAG: ATP-binding protein [Microbacterium sp. 69-10]|uniref:sensor histidine kinase n=1 Tax=Microbacterium sp. 69-10 TaxID=1895783 RepID=UPI0009675FD6|nr:HAMP domain-containing sensor histidine kinase [Microbacterium sp. 69-10]OJU40302.1 MAG: ATP-binding protein [Microbacterium sp. 69-10]
MKARTTGWLLVPVPLVIGGLVGLGFVLAGDERMLQISTALPAVAVGAGAVLSCLVALPLIVVAARGSARRRREAAVAQAVDDGVLREREQHRRFLARLDHELKNPVMAIRAQAAAVEPTPEWRTVDAQAAKLSTLVRDLRKLAELESRPLELEQIDLEELVRESVQAIGQQHPDAAGRFQVVATTVPWPVPKVRGDLDLLSLALDNVLGNAAKYSAQGAIEVRLREQQGTAVIEVADNGRGIPAEDLPQVFDELARAGNARDVPGSGIGLTLVATVLRRHGGDVDVRSVADAGTLVTLRIPAAPAA